ncbi:MAG: N-acetylglucosamine-6-phosphate deacetylase [Frankiaceae bacterium]|nr:N-acetylglucosamine-6-phosphate deacetylase [Frankiaceae bacterium]
MSIISAPKLLVDGHLRDGGAVVVENGMITQVLAEAPPAGPDHLALPHGTLTAGMIDVQINGCYGADFVSALPAEWASVAQRMATTGVTGFQPTFITAPVDTLVAGLERAGAAMRAQPRGVGARILGVHLEGPFLSPQHSGVHDPRWMLSPTPENLHSLYDGPAGRAVTMVTLAPELPGAIEAIRRLAASGIKVSIGHTDATGAEVRAAVAAGAVMVTHLFNAQRGLGHREPGVPGMALADPSLTLGLVADLRHVSAPICQVVFAAAGDRVCVVTDAVASAGMPPGVYELGGQQVRVAANDVLARRLDGTIAGSSLSLDLAVRNLIGIGIDPAQVLKSVTSVPADVLGRRDLGRLAAGSCADLVWWDEDYHPARTWVAGQPVAAPVGATSAETVSL